MTIISELVIDKITHFDNCSNLFFLDRELDLRGITERYLVNSEEDFNQYKNYDYPYIVIKKIIQEEGLNISNANVLDLCSGFGNTVIPLMLDFPKTNVLASDLSEGMLRILIREAIRVDVNHRLEALVCNAQESIWRPSSVDLVIGGAALHHMIDPALTITASISALKKGGRAFFIEPMEAGHCIFSLALLEINGLAEMNDVRYKSAFDFLNGIIKDIDARTHHDTRSVDFHWEDLDDKWVFSRKYLDDIAKKNGSTLKIYPLHSGNNPFYSQAAVCLSSYAKLKFPECLPNKALEILNKYDAIFSSGGHSDIQIEAALVFQKSA